MESTISVKGQITLPKALRDALHLKVGDKVLFEEGSDGTYVIRPRTTDVQMLKGCVSYQGAPQTLEQMDKAIAEHAGNTLS
jgi:antitoxin PrlF